MAGPNDIAALFANNQPMMSAMPPQQQQMPQQPLSIGELLAQTFATLANQRPVDNQPLGFDWATRVRAGEMADRIVAKQRGIDVAGPPISQYERTMR